MANYIPTSKAPALAVSPTQFSQQHFDLFNNQLRIYFNTLDNANAQTVNAVNNLNVMSWLDTGSF
jgi:hypothetical protein